MRSGADVGSEYKKTQERRRQRREPTNRRTGELPDSAVFIGGVFGEPRGEASDKAAFIGLIVEVEIERLARMRRLDYERERYDPSKKDSTRDKQVRGYRRDQFQDVFDRYLDTQRAANPDSNRQTVKASSATGHFWAISKCQKHPLL